MKYRLQSVLAALVVGFLICGGAWAQGVQTLVQAPLSFPVGVALDGAGNVFVANDNDNTVSRIAPDGTVSVFVRNARESAASVEPPSPASSRGHAPR